jgi:hypothetical protein
MNQWRTLILFFVIFFLSSPLSYAAGLIVRQQQMKAMKQQQMQMEIMREREAYLQYQQALLAQQQQQQQQAPAPPTYQQKVEERNQALTQAIADAHHSAVSLEKTQTQSATPRAAAKAEIKDVVDLAEVWKRLDKRSTVWTLLVDNQAKVLTVSEYIDRFHKQGVKINQEPVYYAQMIDQMVTQNPDMLRRPFGELLRMAAIMDYDFDNGMDKDVLAKHVLGPAGFEANKKRLNP